MRGVVLGRKEAQDLSPNDNNRQPEAHAKVMVGHSIVRTRTCLLGTRNPTWNEDLMFVVSEPFDEQFVIYIVDEVAPGKDENIGQCSITLQTVQKRLGPSSVYDHWYILEKRLTVGGDEEKKDAKPAGKVHVRLCLEKEGIMCWTSLLVTIVI